MLYLINNKALDVVTNNNVKIIVIDGLVGLFRMLYHGRGELADRQDILEQIIIKFRNLAIYNNVCIILTNQVMSNPDPFGAKTVAVGGHVFGHNVKYIYAITKGMKNNRTFRLIKSPSQPQADYTFYINEEGVSDFESISARDRKRKADAVTGDSQALIKKDLLID
jgi:DNA repair protein RadA